MQPKVDDSFPSHGHSDCEESFLSSLHTGPTFLTHLYLLTGIKLPVCSACNELLTVDYIFSKCVD